MKTISFLIITFFFFCDAPNASSQNSANSANGANAGKVVKISAKTLAKKHANIKTARIKFAVDKLDFGTVKEDSIVEKKFEFTNVGNSDLMVISARGSCGCTVPTAPIEPIAPGGKGTILVKYTAKNKVGPQKPEITVVTNGTPSIVKVHLEGWVDQIPGGVNKKT